LSKNASSSARPAAGPVGLFGLQTITTLVRSVIASAMASRSCRESEVSGTWTDVAPVTDTAIGYASNDRQA
jgi:hypothetical protein